MKNESISAERVLSKLDEFLYKNDYISAERHLLYWLSEAQNNKDCKTEILVRNELMGLYRKLGKKEKALDTVSAVLVKIKDLNFQNQVGSATTYLNCATVYKAFGMADKAVPLFEKARAIYDKELAPNDDRFGGLYNNMALALVDLKSFKEANELYEKAISVMKNKPNGALEVAITLLNMANAAEYEFGLSEADEKISDCLKKAEELLDNFPKKDGYYAFVCEKCASVFGYYGHFFYESELKERARRIYEGN